SRADIAVSLAGLPTARCGRAPTIMAIAVTAMTCDAQGLAGMSPILSTRAYAIAPAVAIGAASRSPGRFSRSSSPNAISAPNESAACTPSTPLTPVCATDQMSRSPANAMRSHWPESRVCRGNARGSYQRPATLQALDGAQRLFRGRGLRGLPAVPLDRRDERVHEGWIELLARPLAQLGNRLGNWPRATVRAVGGHRVEGVSHREDAGELWDLVAGQPHRVSPAIDPLVMVHDAGEGFVEEADL